MHRPDQTHEQQPVSWLDAEPDERQLMAEADDAEGWELASLRAVGVTEFLDLDDEPAIHDTPAGTEPDWWIIRKTYKNGRESDDRHLYRTREAAQYDIEN
ncbi:hypothetical protein [Xanthomonas vasicola]|uniref:hypothetical protein n=1 Tax=Xanthomonas vasicola TaxID=56459 RepID=UPI002181ECC0|nr:hypothetical protein [Xanthomonas vasicola]